MKNYPEIQFQLDLAQKHLRMGKVLESVEALSMAFSGARELRGSPFRAHSVDIWNEAQNIALTNSSNKGAVVLVQLLHGVIENEVESRAEPIVFPNLSKV